MHIDSTIVTVSIGLLGPPTYLIMTLGRLKPPFPSSAKPVVAFSLPLQAVPSVDTRPGVRTDHRKQR